MAYNPFVPWSLVFIREPFLFSGFVAHSSSFQQLSLCCSCRYLPFPFLWHGRSGLGRLCLTIFQWLSDQFSVLMLPSNPRSVFSLSVAVWSSINKLFIGVLQSMSSTFNCGCYKNLRLAMFIRELNFHLLLHTKFTSFRHHDEKNY